MQVLNPEFVQAVKNKLDKLEAGCYYSREQICISLGLDKSMVNAVTLALQDPLFAGFESVKSRGIRAKKVEESK